MPILLAEVVYPLLASMIGHIHFFSPPGVLIAWLVAAVISYQSRLPSKNISLQDLTHQNQRLAHCVLYSPTFPHQPRKAHDR
jgi:hypothetical protein